ncbi:MAG: NAD(P)-binding protein [Xanthomonadales bacterium]|nr:FAD-dependent oxidoreductase [Gammaproteobacteria bacterium]NNK52089.1 NAD(P)-binding protein [Xanthomonadales bacterium]
MSMINRLALSEQLSERCAELGQAEINAAGEFVLYWAHHALRAHDNPALETAAAIALKLDLPLLVYQGLGGRHRYNSDRHHRFILEAAHDFSKELADLGQRLVFHLPKDPSVPGPLRRLMARSAVVVSELYPVPPFTLWYRQHIESNPDLNLLLVDSSCILPMPLSSSAPTRAFQFRKKHEEELHARVARGWRNPDQWPQVFSGSAGFESFDPGEPLSEAIASCRIDHSIPPVSETRGGSQAGYERWARFLESGLDRYHRLRNDAALPSAVSRMSPYLHYGCVSPFRIAGDAAAKGGGGAEKFLDELLIWRELSHHFCCHSEALESLDALPAWARDSLREHEMDPRSELFDWEILARGRTGQPLWDLAQRSLLRRGELHNNLRMTWGKSLLPWSPRATRALKLMIDLNHRFALDGSDPNSYGGLLWCLGQFDRAFPPGPVFGKVRQRSLKRHAARLDSNRYAQVVSTPAGGKRLRVAVVGAGMAGLTAARILSDQGHDVVVVDKARGPGGRMSTRRESGSRFDHGAQYFTARDARFMRHVMGWQERGLVAAWEPRITVLGDRGDRRGSGETQRFVAVPGMNAICRELAAEQADCRFGWNVQSVQRSDSGWVLRSGEDETLESDVLLLTAPPEQASQLLADEEVDEALAGIEMMPCWALMAVLDKPLCPDWDAAFVNEGPLSWVASQASRPGRPQDQAWVLHAGPEWSRLHLENPPEEIIDWLLEAARKLPISQDFAVTSVVAHRWRYAQAAQPRNFGSLWYETKNLALAGAWCHGSRVEGAFLSGAAAAGRIMGSRAARTDSSRG